MTQVYVRARVLWMQALASVRKTLGEDKGSTVAEYALVLVLIAVALITVLGDLGKALQARIQDVISKLPNTP